MNTGKVLVITSREDSHADYVIDKFNMRGLEGKIIRLNTEDFLANSKFSFSKKAFRVQLKDSEREFTNHEIISVWYRRPKKINSQLYDDIGINMFVEKQANAVLRGLYFCIHDSALWINPLTSMHRARIKIQQISLANKLKFNVPETIITNNPEEALDFFEQHQIICNKSIDEPSFTIEGQLYPYLTKVVMSRDEIINAYDSISKCPTLFQQFIYKLFDIRVIVIGSQIFAFEIHSQRDELSKVDFRGKSPDHLIHKPHKLPKPICDKLLDFMNMQGLVFSAFDFVYSTDRKYYFLENNCNGQWLWLELLTGVQISEQLIKMLVNGKDSNSN